MQNTAVSCHCQERRAQRQQLLHLVHVGLHPVLRPAEEHARQLLAVLLPVHILQSQRAVICGCVGEDGSVLHDNVKEMQPVRVCQLPQVLGGVAVAEVADGALQPAARISD